MLTLTPEAAIHDCTWIRMLYRGNCKISVITDTMMSEDMLVLSLRMQMGLVVIGVGASGEGADDTCVIVEDFDEETSGSDDSPSFISLCSPTVDVAADDTTIPDDRFCCSSHVSMSLAVSATRISWSQTSVSNVRPNIVHIL
jgi:hypothetical protein